MKVIFTIFVLPHELDDLRRVLIDLNRASKYVDGSNYEFCISMSVSEYLIDWNTSKISKSFFVNKFNSLKKLTNWSNKATFQIREEILGALQAKRYTHLEFKHATHFIWLDTDIVFDEMTLIYIENAIRGIEASGHEKYIITPEIVRYWDTTWDCLVNENFLNKELDYCKTCNPFTESGIKGEVRVEEVSNTIFNQPRFKFGAGWFTLISKPLLDRIPLPASMGAYGPDDTFLMWAMEKLKKAGINITQFKLKNCVVCENFKYRNQQEYDALITRIDRKDEFLKIAQKNLVLELHNIL
jgi:hypothetical protein